MSYYPNVYASQAGPLALSTLDANFNFAVDIQSQALYSTAGGTANALTATYTPTVTALVSGLTLYVRAGFANTTTTPTFSPDGFTAATIVKTNNQPLKIGEIAGNGHVLILQYDGINSNWELLNPATIYTNVAQIQPISASVAANALTISASALSLDFRSTTLGSGTVTTVSGTPSNLVVPSTATLGTVNAVQSRLMVLALNNAGTIELAVVNLAGGVNLSETGVVTTTAISTGSTSSSVIYSTTARTGVAYRVIGYIESTQTTAGTWATAPSTIQGAGGQALTRSSAVQSVVRLNTANGFGSTNTSIRRFTNTVTNQGTDITYADSATLGASFTINTSGIYAISHSDSFASGTGAFGVSLNSTQLSTGIQSITISDVLAFSFVPTANNSLSVATTLFLTTGSVIRAHTGTSNAGGAGVTLFTIVRVS